MSPLSIKILDEEFSIHRLQPGSPFPAGLTDENYYWAAGTEEELSIVCRSNFKINGPVKDEGWKVLKLIGPFPLSAAGILSAVSSLLAERKISIFALSTYDTDYLLVKLNQLDEAVQCLSEAGYLFV